MTQKDEVYFNHSDNSSEKETQSKNKSTNQENNQPDFNFGKMSKNINLIDFVKYPVITEKTATATLGSKNPQYTFDVDKRLTKPQIKKLFEIVFNINVVAVNTHIPPRTTVRVGVTKGYRPSYKRAIITLQENQSIKFISKSASITP